MFGISSCAALVAITVAALGIGATVARSQSPSSSHGLTDQRTKPAQLCKTRSPVTVSDLPVTTTRVLVGATALSNSSLARVTRLNARYDGDS